MKKGYVEQKKEKFPQYFLNLDQKIYRVITNLQDVKNFNYM